MNPDSEKLAEILDLLTQGRGNELVELPEGSWPYPDQVAYQIAEWAAPLTEEGERQFPLDDTNTQLILAVTNKHLHGRYWLIRAVPSGPEDPESSAVIAGAHPKLKQPTTGDTHLVDPRNIDEDQDTAKAECGITIPEAAKNPDWSGPDGIPQTISCSGCRNSELYKTMKNGRARTDQKPQEATRPDHQQGNQNSPDRTERPREQRHQDGEPGPRSGPNNTQSRPQEGTGPRAPIKHANELAGQWQAALKALSKEKGTKYNIGALLRDCRPENLRMNGEVLTAPFRNANNLERMREELGNHDVQQKVNAVLTDALGVHCRLEATLENR